MSVLSVEGSPGGEAAECCDGAVKAGREGVDNPPPPAEQTRFRDIAVVFFTAQVQRLDLACAVNNILWMGWNETKCTSFFKIVSY